MSCYFSIASKAVAKKLHKVDVDVKLLQGHDHDHGQFLIEEKNCHDRRGNEESQEVDHLLSNGCSIISFFISVYFNFGFRNSTEDLVAALLPRFSLSRAV